MNHPIGHGHGSRGDKRRGAGIEPDEDHYTADNLDDARKAEQAHQRWLKLGSGETKDLLRSVRNEKQGRYNS